MNLDKNAFESLMRSQPRGRMQTLINLLPKGSTARQAVADALDNYADRHRRSIAANAVASLPTDLQEQAYAHLLYGQPERAAGLTTRYHGKGAR